jgi:hypothetical protein
MNDNDDFNRFLPDGKPDEDKLSVEILAEQQPVSHERLPSGFDPMGEIHLRGQAYRGLAGGRVPWWILISGWIIFGLITAVILHAVITASSLTAWILLAIALIPLVILWRGTAAKLSGRQ